MTPADGSSHFALCRAGQVSIQLIGETTLFLRKPQIKCIFILYFMRKIHNAQFAGLDTLFGAG